MHRPTATALLLASFLVAAFMQPALAVMTATPKLRVGTPHFSIMEWIMDAGLRRSVTDAPVEPLVTWLAPADPRIHDSNILAAPAGRLYAVRSLEGVFESAAAAVDYGVLQLLTPILLITVQTDNQALPPRTSAPALPLDSLEQSLDIQIHQAVERYEKRIANQRLVVVGGIIDLANNYNRGAGRLIITNVNGETDSATLQKMPLMRRLDRATRAYIGRRGKAILTPPRGKKTVPSK